MRTMLRWIAVLLIVVLPMRSGMAAMQLCPWMALESVDHVVMNAADFSSMDSCPGMSSSGDVCHLQAACTATPILPHELQASTPQTTHLSTPWRPIFVPPIASVVPQRIPITFS